MGNTTVVFKHFRLHWEEKLRFIFYGSIKENQHQVEAPEKETLAQQN